MAKRVILGSSSPYRRQILEKLGIRFECISPEIDEQALPGEAPETLVTRLAFAKAKAVQQQSESPAIIITSDQVAVLNGRILTKPGNHQNAVAQLRFCRGNAVVFHTSLCVLNSAANTTICENIPFTVHFRQLSDVEIENYLLREKPYDCAGSFKSEGLGITLFERFEGDDPNTLIGLPIMRLNQLLIKEGINPLLFTS